MRVPPVLAAALVACEPAASDGPADTPADTADTAAACGTWEDVGHPFVLTWCTACHSSALPDDARAGAPAGVDFDTLEGVQRWSDRIAARALVDAPDMPAGGGPDAAERDAVRAWLACGAPGDDTRITPGTAPTGLLDAGVLALLVEQDGAEVLATMWDGNLPLYELRYTRDDEGAATWLGWSRYVDGALVETIDFSPPLPLYDPRATAWDAVTTATVETDAGTTAESHTWTFTRGSAGELDPRVGDPDAEELVAVEASGETHRWWLSDDYGAVLETHARPAAVETVLLYGTRPFGQDLRGFSVAEGTSGSGWYWSREVP